MAMKTTDIQKLTREEIAETIIKYRLQHSLKQTELARMCKVSRWTIIRIEKRVPIHWKTAYKVLLHLVNDSNIL